MKTRTHGFIADDKIDHNGEVFDYIRELHEYLHGFCGGGHGNLQDYLDRSLDRFKTDMAELRAYRRLFNHLEWSRRSECQEEAER